MGFEPSPFAASGITANRFSTPSLGVGVLWELVHAPDVQFKRLIQVWRDILYTNTSLDFSLISEPNWTQQDATKTTFVSDRLQLEGITPNVYAHYLLNSSSGSIAYDVSGNARHGNTVNNPAWVAGKLNNCLLFVPASTQYVDCLYIAAFERTDPFSLECWFKTTSAANINLIGKQQTVAPLRGYSLDMDVGQLRFLMFNTYPTNGLAVRTNSAFNDGNWHHVVCTYDGSSNGNNVNFYVDGVLQAKTVTLNILSATILAPGQTLNIAARNATLIFDGRIDEVVIHNRVVPLSYVTFRYNAGAGTESMDYPIGDWYVTTNVNQINTASWSIINYVTTTTSIPVNTALRFLVSVDGRVTWKAWNGAAWVNVTLANISTQGMTKAVLEALTITQWSLIFVAGTLDFAIDLKTTDNYQTPMIDQLNVFYAISGKVKCTDAEVELTLISATKTGVRNISSLAMSDLGAMLIF